MVLKPRLRPRQKAPAASTTLKGSGDGLAGKARKHYSRNKKKNMRTKIDMTTVDDALEDRRHEERSGLVNLGRRGLKKKRDGSHACVRVRARVCNERAAFLFACAVYLWVVLGSLARSSACCSPSLSSSTWPSTSFPLSLSLCGWAARQWLEGRLAHVVFHRQPQRPVDQQGGSAVVFHGRGRQEEPSAIRTCSDH